MNTKMSKYVTWQIAPDSVLATQIILFWSVDLKWGVLLGTKKKKLMENLEEYGRFVSV